MTIITPGTAAAGSVVTAQLANNSVTDAKIDFGTGANQVSTADIPEQTNLYYTDERVDDRVNALLTAGSNITLTYDDAANTLTIAAVEDNLSNNDTDDLSEGSSNLYFTDARAKSAVLTTHSGNITLGSDAIVNIVGGTDSGEYIYLNAPQNFIGVSGVGFQFDTTTGPNKAQISAYGTTDIVMDENLDLNGNLDVSGFIANDRQFIGTYDISGAVIRADNNSRWPAMIIEGYGTGPFSITNPGLFFIQGGGTSSSITALGNGSRFGVLGGVASNGATLPTTANAQIEMITKESQTGSARGASIIMESTANGATSRTETAEFHGNDTTLINLIASGTVVLSNLPSSDPANAGQLYKDTNGFLKVSAG